MIELLSAVLICLSLALLAIVVVLLRKAYRLYKFVLARTMPEISAKKLRKRYVVFAAVCEEKVTYEKLSKTIRNAFIELYGKAYTHKASPRLVLFDEGRQRGVVRVLHIYTDHLVAALGLVRNVEGVDCILVPYRTTGTIKKAKKYLDVIKP
ncbi:MAG: Rpp14/Pop5 family protein [Desulfurococcaceae archaeon]